MGGSHEQRSTDQRAPDRTGDAEQILDSLQRLEVDHDVKVLFACESGSRGWGFASPDSDYDVRFIYVNRLSWYLTVESGRDVIEQPISGDLDVNGWDLRKTLQLLRQSNPTLLEWLRSPIVYLEEADTVARLRALAEDGFSAVRGYHHYVSMAKKNFREHLRGRRCATRSTCTCCGHCWRRAGSATGEVCRRCALQNWRRPPRRSCAAGRDQPTAPSEDARW